MENNNQTTNKPQEGAPVEGWGKKQKALTFVNVAIMILVALGILAGVNYVSRRQFYRYDCTFSKEYSLSTKSKELIQQLQEPLTIYTFFVQPQDQAIFDIQKMMTDLLEEYKIYSNGKIFVEKITVAANPEMVIHHVDAIESMGFTNHFKLPHYVTFQSDMDRLRTTQAKAAAAQDPTQGAPA